jgi:patatin-related protein
MAMAALHGLPEEEYEELRLALVMNGGVSLAVWIGGVANEINRAATRDRNRADLVYRALLDLTASQARVDVISGTSAGGINGGLLGLAQVYGSELTPLRDVWLERGAFDQLLRDPYRRNPTSLLRGDEYFLVQLRDAFRRVKAAGTRQPVKDVPIDLTLTTTLLHGEPFLLPDDFGTIVSDVSHRGRFHFCRGEDVAGPDAFADSRIDEKLALAARATASFPVAFEPVFCYMPNGSASTTPPDGALPMDPYASFHRSRFLLDGGILDNKPFDAAIAAIFKQRARHEVRRVLCYIVPAPGETASDTADDPKDIPSLGTVALASLINIPRVQSTSTQLEEIVEHNRSVRRKRQTRIALTRDVGWEGVQGIAQRLFTVYRKRRLESAVDYILDQVSEGLSVTSDGQSALGRRRREWLAAIFSQIPGIPWVPDAVPSPDTIDSLAGWNWGAFALENIVDVMLDLLRRAVSLTTPYDLETRQTLRFVRSLAYDIVAEVPQLRDRDRSFWKQQGRSLFDALQDVTDPTAELQAARQWAEKAVAAWRARPFILSGKPGALEFGPRLDFSVDSAGQRTLPMQEGIGWLSWAVANLIAAIASLLRQIVDRARGGTRRESAQVSADEFRALVAFLVPEDLPAIVLTRLLTLEVAQYALASSRDVPDQFVELVQVSADVATAFGGPDSAAAKLAGAQLANFGGFYKKSWRANDWMFGRLDGAERIARILLNPARIARLYEGHHTAEEIAEAIGRIAVPDPGDGDAPDRDFLNSLWEGAKSSVARELAFIDNPDYPYPEQLNCAVASVLPRMQLAILRAELPSVANAAADDQLNGDDQGGPSAQFLQTVLRLTGQEGMRAFPSLPAKQIVDLFLGCHVGEERIASQVGSDLFTKTVTRTLAVATTALAGKGAGLGIVSRVVQMVRIPTLVLDALSQSIVKRSRTGTAIFFGAWAASTVIVALDLLRSVAKNLPDTLLVIAWVVFAAAGMLVTRRSPRVAMGWIAFVLILFLVAEASHLPLHWAHSKATPP